MFRVATKINLFREFLLVDKLIFLRSVYIRPTRELLVVPLFLGTMEQRGTTHI